MKKNLVKVVLGIMLVLAIGFASVACSMMTYTVSFDVGADVTGTAPSTQEVLEGLRIELPDFDGTREGYFFAGWTLDGKDYAVGDRYTVTKDVTFTAKWEEANPAVEWTASFDLGICDSEDAIVPADITTVEGEPITLPDIDFTWEGYTFLGWEVKDDPETPLFAAGDTFMVRGDITFVAKWRNNTNPAVEWTATFELGICDLEDAVLPADKTKEEGQEIVLPAIGFEWEGYTFIGWRIKDDPEHTLFFEGDTYTLRGDVTFVAQWRDNTNPAVEWTAKFNYGDYIGDEEVPEDITKEEGDSITLPGINFVWEGYNFLGWIIEDDPQSPLYKAGDTYRLRGDVTFIAQWEEVQDTKVELPDDLDGIYVSSNGTSITIEGLQVAFIAAVTEAMYDSGIIVAYDSTTGKITVRNVEYGNENIIYLTEDGIKFEDVLYTKKPAGDVEIPEDIDGTYVGVSKLGATITVEINGTEVTITTAWRDGEPEIEYGEITAVNGNILFVQITYYNVEIVVHADGSLTYDGTICTKGGEVPSEPELVLPDDLDGIYVSNYGATITIDEIKVEFAMADGSVYDSGVIIAYDSTTGKITVHNEEYDFDSFIYLTEDGIEYDEALYTRKTDSDEDEVVLPEDLDGTYIYDGEYLDITVEIDGTDVTITEDWGWDDPSVYNGEITKVKGNVLTVTISGGSYDITITIVGSGKIDYEGNICIKEGSEDPDVPPVVEPELVLPDDLDGTYVSNYGATITIDELQVEFASGGYVYDSGTIVAYDSTTGKITVYNEEYDHDNFIYLTEDGIKFEDDLYTRKTAGDVEIPEDIDGTYVGVSSLGPTITVEINGTEVTIATDWGFGGEPDVEYGVITEVNGNILTVTIDYGYTTSDYTIVYLGNDQINYDGTICTKGGGEDPDVPPVDGDDEIVVGEEVTVIIPVGDFMIDKSIYLDAGKYTITISGAGVDNVKVRDISDELGEGGDIIVPGETSTSVVFTVEVAGEYTLRFIDNLFAMEGMSFTVLVAEAGEEEGGEVTPGGDDQELVIDEKYIGIWEIENGPRAIITENSLEIDLFGQMQDISGVEVTDEGIIFYWGEELKRFSLTDDGLLYEEYYESFGFVSNNVFTKVTRA